MNRHCVDQAIRAALIFQCEIHEKSTFDRKHYFYHDLPHGYQITQHFEPLANNGKLDMYLSDGCDREFTVGIHQIQLEMVENGFFQFFVFLSSTY